MNDPVAPVPLSTSWHATAIAAGGRALLITGPAGAGKSALALEMIALGAGLISDDLVALSRRGHELIASAPTAATGDATAGQGSDVQAMPVLLEARGIGLIPIERRVGPTPVCLVMDLGITEGARLPPARFSDILGCRVRTLRRPSTLSASALLLALRAGGPVDPD